MDFSQYKWNISPQTQNLISEIEILKKVFEKLPLPEPEIQIIRKRSFLNSAVSSAQVENIPSTIQSPRQEGKNLELAYKWIYSNQDLPTLSVDIIKNLHFRVMTGLSGSAGQFRNESWGVFNEGGMEIHHVPLHTLLPLLVKQLSRYINNLEAHPVIVSAVSQFVFEKIHPFADGNGRTGRLISFYVLHKSNYDFGGLVSIEKYINKNRGLYYQALEPSHNCNFFIDFFINAIVSQANQTLEELKNPPINVNKSKLLPRRRELLETIKDHPECSFDFLHRRFMSLNPVSLHRDLKYLQEQNLIDKLGSTQAVVYVAKSDIL